MLGHVSLQQVTEAEVRQVERGQYLQNMCVWIQQLLKV
jgi:hypothetical protein